MPSIINILKKVQVQQPVVPPSIPGQEELWFDFTDLATQELNGNKIISITDKFNNIILNQTNDSIRPLSYNNGDNNRSYCKTSNLNFLQNIAYSLPQPFTVTLVLKVPQFVQQPIIDFGSDLNAIAFKRIATQTTQFGTWYKDSLSDVAGTSWTTQQVPGYYLTNSLMFASFVRDSSSSEDCINGSFGNLAATSPGSSSISRLRLGGYMEADIYEIFIHSGHLTRQNIYDLNSYIRQKYAITNTPNLINFGDSISFGANGTGGYGFAQLIAISSTPVRFTLSNLAFSGYTIDSIISYMENYLPYMDRNSYILLQIGTNDNPSNFVEWKAKVESVVTYALGLGYLPVRFCLSTPPYSSTRVSVLSGIQTVFQELATEYNLRYADCVTPTLNGGGDTLLADGTHPNDAGHLIMYNTIIDAFIFNF